MKVKLGVWLTRYGLWLAKKGMDLSGVTDLLDTTNSTKDCITIHSVIGGPYTQSDAGTNWQGPYEAEAYLLVKLEYDSQIEDREWYFETVEEAFGWVRHFKTSIDPIVIEGRPD